MTNVILTNQRFSVEIKTTAALLMQDIEVNSANALIYASRETDRMEIWVTPIPGPGPHVMVSVNGGSEPA